MVDLVPPPEPHRLLPPLLACLPTAFASHRPPPALLPLVSPILRQRLQLINSSSASSSASASSENWLRLLCWDKEKANKLKDVVENGTYEPHPSSGEIEVGDIGAIKYKRLDLDTLRAQIALPEWSLTALYLWIAEGEGGSGWRLAELLPYDSELERNPTWSHSMGEANESSRERMVSEAIRDAEAAEKTTAGQDDDDDYWAQYDRTPGPTPAQNRSPAPNTPAADADYYAQYGEVQLAIATHDPSEEANGTRNSSLSGDILAGVMQQESEGTVDRGPIQQGGLGGQKRVVEAAEAPVSLPPPASLSPASSDAVTRLEERADQQSASEMGIRQHISTTMKSLYRLANSAGMEGEEFDRIIQRELETNSMLDE